MLDECVVIIRYESHPLSYLTPERIARNEYNVINSIKEYELYEEKKTAFERLSKL